MPGWAAGRALRPVRDLASAARRIHHSDLSRRLPVAGSGEIAELTTTFNEMLDRLEAAFVSQRSFIDDAGHELRTPITIIQGHLELMSDDPEERRETLALVGEELERMNRYVEELLLLARAEQPQFLRRQTVDLAEFTHRLVNKAGALAPRRWCLDGVGSGRFVADPDRLTQAVMNLARNAAEHTADNDEIGVGSAMADGQIRIWVRDGGPGIATADHARVFERHVRLGDTRGDSEGAGLGLAIVQAVARAHRGRVELASRPGSGATFTVVVPAEPEEPER